MSDVTSTALGELEGVLRPAMEETFGRLVFFQGHDQQRAEAVRSALGVSLREAAPFLTGDRVVTVPVESPANAALAEEVELLRALTAGLSAELRSAREVAEEAGERLFALAKRHAGDRTAVEARQWLEALRSLEVVGRLDAPELPGE